MIHIVDKNSIINDALVQSVIHVGSQEQSNFQKQTADVSLRLQHLFNTRYASVSRWQAASFTNESDQQLISIDASIRDNEGQINAALTRVEEHLVRARELSFPTEGPYFEAFEEMRSAFWLIWKSYQWQHWQFYVHEQQKDRLFGIVQDTKDVEVETQRIQAKKELVDQMVADYREELKDARTYANDVNKQYIVLATQFEKTVAHVNELAARLGVPAEPPKEPTAPDKEPPSGEVEPKPRKSKT